MERADLEEKLVSHEARKEVARRMGIFVGSLSSSVDTTPEKVERAIDIYAGLTAFINGEKFPEALVSSRVTEMILSGEEYIL